MDLNKTITLRTLFIRFLATLLVFLGVSAAIPILLLLFGVNMGYLTSANISEAVLQEAQLRIGSAREFSSDLVPEGMEYILMDKTLSVLETSMDDNDAGKALRFAKGEYNNSMNSQRFSLVTRDNGYVVIKYSLGSRYGIVKLNGILPSPEHLCFIFIGINVILSCVILTLLFAKKTKKQIVPLHEAAQQIGKQNLDFEVGNSKIKELNDVFSSFKDMKKELKNSLEKQWLEEQNQKEQIAALAHDLKTPLTVVIGNADLLQETKLSSEQSDYVNNLLEYAGFMEQSVSTLIELSRSTSGYTLQLSTVNISDFLEGMEQKIRALTALKEIQTKYTLQNLPNSMECDPVLLDRAILNVVSNAVDYTPNHGGIQCEVNHIDKNLTFTVTDTGKGFSRTDLAQAKQQFYIGDSSRSSRKHYGMGLTIAENIALQHGGKLSLENDTTDLAGARVTIYIPIT